MEHALCHALYFLNKTTASTFFHRYDLLATSQNSNSKIRQDSDFFFLHILFSHSDIKTLLDSMQMTIINVTTSPKCQIDESKLCGKGNFTITHLTVYVSILYAI